MKQKILNIIIEIKISCYFSNKIILFCGISKILLQKLHYDKGKVLVCIYSKIPSHPHTSYLQRDTLINKNGDIYESEAREIR